MKQLLFCVAILVRFHVSIYAQNTTDSLNRQKGDPGVEDPIRGAGITQAQKEQLKHAQESINQQIRQVRQSNSLSGNQKQQQVQQLLIEKKKRYRQIMGEAKYREFVRLRGLPSPQ
jgi:hypothetical protein